MARGKRQQGGPLIPLSSEGGPQLLPNNLVRSLRTRSPRVAKPPVVAADGTVSTEGLAALAALAAQMDAQVARYDWNGTRVPNAMLAPPEGMSGSKYRSTLTPLRKAGLVHTHNGLWWVVPAGYAKLAGPQSYLNR